MADEYADVVGLKLYMGITDSERDDLLTQSLAAASRGIDRMCGRRFYLDPVPVQRVYSPGRRSVCVADGERLLVDDMGAVDDLVVETGIGGSWTTVSDFETAPDNALLDGRPITGLTLLAGTWGYRTSRVRVTARWGWPAVPEVVTQATLIQAARLFKRKDSPEGILGSAEWGTVRLSRVDPDVAALVQNFILPGFG